jgi:hypothetical protein
MTRRVPFASLGSLFSPAHPSQAEVYRDRRQGIGRRDPKAIPSIPRRDCGHSRTSPSARCPVRQRLGYGLEPLVVDPDCESRRKLETAVGTLSEHRCPGLQVISHPPSVKSCSFRRIMEGRQACFRHRRGHDPHPAPANRGFFRFRFARHSCLGGTGSLEPDRPGQGRSPNGDRFHADTVLFLRSRPPASVLPRHCPATSTVARTGVFSPPQMPRSSGRPHPGNDWPRVLC